MEERPPSRWPSTPTPTTPTSAVADRWPVGPRRAARCTLWCAPTAEGHERPASGPRAGGERAASWRHRPALIGLRSLENLGLPDGELADTREFRGGLVRRGAAPASRPGLRARSLRLLRTGLRQPPRSSGSQPSRSSDHAISGGCPSRGTCPKHGPSHQVARGLPLGHPRARRVDRRHERASARRSMPSSSTPASSPDAVRSGSSEVVQRTGPPEQRGDGPGRHLCRVLPSTEARALRPGAGTVPEARRHNPGSSGPVTGAGNPPRRHGCVLRHGRGPGQSRTPRRPTGHHQGRQQPSGGSSPLSPPEPGPTACTPPCPRYAGRASPPRRSSCGPLFPVLGGEPDPLGIESSQFVHPARRADRTRRSLPRRHRSPARLWVQPVRSPHGHPRTGTGRYSARVCAVGGGRVRRWWPNSPRGRPEPRSLIRGRHPRGGPGCSPSRPTEELAFVHPLPLEALWGVGPATARRLQPPSGSGRWGSRSAIPEGTSSCAS